MSREIYGLFFLLALVILVNPAIAAGTTQVHIIRYAIDGTTILNESTVDYTWMQANLPVYGDDVTEWYLQGPVYPTYGPDRWNPAEDVNLKNWGRNKGTDVKDLCDLVGGAKPGETISILANDGLGKTFPYQNIYSPDPRQGRMVLAWWYNDTYVPSFDNGIRLIFLADTSTNPSGYHCYGVWDMNQTLPSTYHYFNYNNAWGGDPLYPSTTGLSVKWVDRVLVYSNDPVPVHANFSANVTSGIAPLTVQFTDNSTGSPISRAWDFDNNGITDSTLPSPVYTYNMPGTYSVNLTVMNSAGSDSLVRTGYITVSPAPSPDYSLPLSGHHNVTLTRTQFEAIVASGPNVTFTDSKGTWKGVPLWYLAGIVDDGDGLTFNDTLAAQGYTVNVTSTYGSPYTKSFASASIARNDNYIVANTLNGTPLPFTDPSSPSKNWWPLKLVGSSATGGSSVGNITEIRLIGVPTAPGPSEWSLPLYGRQNVILTRTQFEAIVASGPNVTFTDSKGTWKGVPLWYLAGIVDDGDGLTFNDTLAAQGYTVNVTSTYGSPYTKSFASASIARNDNYIVANTLNGTPLPFTDPSNPSKYWWPLKLVGSSATGGSSVGNITEITLAGLPEVPPGTPDWTISLVGARNQTVTKTYFEQGLACTSSGHLTNYTDANGAVWSGVPLWLLVAMVDDNPDTGPDHFNFNDALAAQGYSVKVTSGDGWSTTLASADIARNSGYIVANKVNGTDLPFYIGTKPSWPLHLKGSAIFGGQSVGNITTIELTGLPQPAAEWNVTMEGAVTDVIPQSLFEGAIACRHNVTYTDSTGSVWQGVPLWDLAGTVDDIETTSHWTYNDTVATAGYTIRVIAGDGFNATFASGSTSHNEGYIVAFRKNGTALTGTSAPLKLVGPATTSGGQRVGNIVKIRLEGLPSYPAGEYNLTLNGRIKAFVNQPQFEEWVAANNVSYTDGSGNVYSGIPLWRLLAWVDDRIPAGSNAFNETAAEAGYKVIVKAGDGYAKEFASAPIAYSNDYIVANRLNGTPLPTTGSHPPWPLRLVGAGASGGSSVGNIVEIQLTDFQTPVAVPAVHVIKYAADGVTVINETTVDYRWMEDHLPVYGDGVTHYKFEAITNNPSDLWDPAETYPGGYKVDNVVKGTSIRDLCELVGGMGSGTDLKMVASDGYETVLGYSNIYTNPAVAARQGEAILAWWGDGSYVPAYADGYRLFFTGNATGDHVFSQWDMHECVRSDLWHYYYDQGTQYPSCAGMSAKYVRTVKIYSSPAADWNLALDGRPVGGINYAVSKAYFEQAMACQFGSNHEVNYTDSQGRVWSGMPLWFLCGFVDDADQHSSQAYNQSLAQAGYNVTITARDNSSITIDSRYTIRSNNYIVANSLNGTAIPDADSSWPLRLVGPNATGQLSIKKIASVQLIPFASSPPTLSIVPASSAVPVGSTTQYQLVLSSAPSGLAGYNLTISLANPAAGTITAVSYPSWGILNTTSPLPEKSLTISAVDLPKQVQNGSVNVLLATVTVRGDAPGTSGLNIMVKQIDADGGGVITPVVNNGIFASYVPLLANFTATPLTGTRPLTVSFTDLSTGNPLSSWAWDFNNDGVVDNTTQSPAFTYSSVGYYTVNLTVRSAYDSSSLVKTNYIRVRYLVVPFPGYTNDPTDPDDDNLYEDINGNGRLDFDDVVAYYWNMDWITANTEVGIAPYDFNHNGRIDYDDVVVLYYEVLG
jgi:PKD repeat protein